MSQNTQPALGQRWLSNAEVELGLGTIVAMEGRTISLLFPASGESRHYASKDAPITRVTFSAGDVASHHEGWQFKVEQTTEESGIVSYQGKRLDTMEQVDVKETFISHDFVLSEPSDRLLNGHFDNPRWFEMRKRSIEFKQSHFSSDILGFVGARVQLIPHQLHIAKEVGSRVAPRVLLADEVGLGKTIEAAFIVHQQLLNERAQRVLIVVPDSLVNQWLVEMLRKFNLSFAIFDEKRCESLSEEPVNPFETEQLVLCSLNFLTHNSRYFQQAIEADWDLMVVDEAHHLKWSPGNPSQEYEVIEHLAKITKGVLLLTATPDQLGHESHFARLRLLDPDRFHDYQQFLAEERQYTELAQVIEPLLQDGVINSDQMAALESKMPDLMQRYSSVAEDVTARQELVSELLDRHGTGRVLFRNSRNTISGFPSRMLHATVLNLPDAYQEEAEQLSIAAQLTPEIYYAGSVFWTDFDPRVEWFIDLLSGLKSEKVLTICANAVTALDLADALRTKAGIRATVFHEGMSIVERDKAANYFAQTEDGAQVLLASEIGSEGRNFQFAHHLVLFDLPLNPDLLEQRIGRLDRIGQKHDISIHVPVFENTAQEVLMKWYDRGLNAFSKTCPTGAVVFDEMQETLKDCLLEPENTEAVDSLLTQSAALHNDMLAKLEQGRDKLLEINSSGGDKIENLIEQLQDEDDSPTLERFMANLLDTLGVVQEEKDDFCYLLRPTESMVNQIPGLDDEGMTVTYERDTATQLEHVSYLTWDHPLVHNAIDMLLSDVNGKSSMAFMANKKIPAGFFWLECVFVLSAKGQRELQLKRYFPDTPIQITVDAKGNAIEHNFIDLSPVSRKIGAKLVAALGKQVEASVAIAEKLAQTQITQLQQAKQENIEQLLGAEIQRLESLQKVNPAIRDDEIEQLITQKKALIEAVAGATLRLEAVRMVVNNP